MASPTPLEDLYLITEKSYTTGSEWLDGLVIGLTTMLLIRNAELVVFDLLTFFFGDRRHHVGFRVLRVWQMLNINHFYNLVTGFDSDISDSRLRKSHRAKRCGMSTHSSCKVKKGKFASFLFVSVLFGKLFILGAEVAIIAFVIPVANVHKNAGGLGFRWKNATITEASLSRFSTCQPLLTSRRLTDSAQIALCRRVDVRDSFKPLPQNWTASGSLRVEEIHLTPDRVRQAGGVVTGSFFDCSKRNVDGESSSVRLYSHETSRQEGYVDEPNMEFENITPFGEITISGNCAKSVDGNFHLGSAAIIPIFSDAQRTLRLAFTNFFAAESLVIGGEGPTINGKLLFSSGMAATPGRYGRDICPDAINEIIRVTGTLHPELVIDLFRSSMTVHATESFSEPSPDVENLRTARGFEIGTSRRFRIQPEWMGLAAALVIILSTATSRLNKTEVRMSRVYREHNNMGSACSPAFLDEEIVVEGALFQRENEYHWGESPGEDWEKLSEFEFCDDVDRDGVILS